MFKKEPPLDKGKRPPTDDHPPTGDQPIDEQLLEIDAAAHRRILKFLNDAVYVDELVFEKRQLIDPELEDLVHEDNPDAHRVERKKILEPEVARRILEAREREFPLGFRNLRELIALRVIDRAVLGNLIHLFSSVFFGSWSSFPQPIPRRGNAGGIDGVVHAAMLHTGKVLFITADETTLLWDPNDTTPATFDDPLNQPQTTPDAASGYSVLCGGHSFLSDGRLLVVGGGGYGPHSAARWGYKFDPVAKTWSRTAGAMVDHRWYPTVLTLGDQRIGNSHEILVVCGHGGGDMEIYDEVTDTFREVTAGDTKPFPSLYPGLHLLPNHGIFYSRTGWSSAGPGGGPVTGDDQSEYFMLTGSSTGMWNTIAPVAPTTPDRTKGMSVMLLSSTPPYVRIMVIGGADAATNNTYEIIDATALSPAANWGPALPFPDGQHRSLASAVLLPDGNVFVCGGIQTANSPCATFNPQTNTWSAMAALPSIRDYHSVAILLPSGQVMMAGWQNSTIEIFDPPYMFAGPRPTISAAPPLVHHGQTFTIDSPDAPSIAKVVLVRPMAVTHQTDTEQKVLEMPVTHTSATQLTLTAPHGGHPHSLAQQGYYMMFAVNGSGIPSVATWIYLH